MFHGAGPGRPKGSPNKTSAAVREIALSIINDPAYRAALAVRVRAGSAPQMEQLLWHYAHGKPKDTVSLEGADGSPLIFSLNLTRPHDDITPDVARPDDNT